MASFILLLVLIESVVTNLMKENLIIDKKTASGFDSYFRSNAPLNEETMLNVIVDNSQDKNDMTIDESVTFCHLIPQRHSDIDTPSLQNTFTPEHFYNFYTCSLDCCSGVLISALTKYLSEKLYHYTNHDFFRIRLVVISLFVTYCIHVSSSGGRESSFFITDAG